MQKRATHDPPCRRVRGVALRRSRRCMRATLAQLDAWLATAPNVVREKSPGGPEKGPRYVSVKGMRGSGWLDPDLITDGYLANGQRVMIVPIDSGGTGGVFNALLFTQIGGATRFVAPCRVRLATSASLWRADAS